MAVREFTDSNLRQWTAWEVTPDKINPRTKDEDFLASLYQTGWIVFESKDGGDKRRLYPVPRGWTELPVPELEVLLQKAEVVPERKLRSEQQAIGGEAAQAMERAADLAERLVDDPEHAGEIVREETPDVTDLGVVRNFRYPGGRIWTVCVIQRPEDGGMPVLRFTAGARYIDLREWPKDWADYPDQRLVELLRSAAPRKRSAPLTPDTPRRRYDDTPLSP